MEIKIRYVFGHDDGRKDFVFKSIEQIEDIPLIKKNLLKVKLQLNQINLWYRYYSNKHSIESSIANFKFSSLYVDAWISYFRFT